MKIIFDFNRTLFNPESQALYPGAKDLLERLSMQHELFLISMNEPGRNNLLEQLGINQFFKKVIFVDKKTADSFRELVGETRQAIVVGDRITEEIRIGNQLGFVTIRLKQGKFADQIPSDKMEEPNFTVHTIIEILNKIREIIHD